MYVSEPLVSEQVPSHITRVHVIYGESCLAMLLWISDPLLQALHELNDCTAQMDQHKQNNVTKTHTIRQVLSPI